MGESECVCERERVFHPLRYVGCFMNVIEDIDIKGKRERELQKQIIIREK